MRRAIAHRPWSWFYVVLLACGSNPEGPTGDLSIVISPASPVVIVGGHSRLTASVRDGSGQPVDEAVDWTTSSAQVIAVARDGTITGLAPGQATVTARVGTASASVTVTVPELPQTGVAGPGLESFDRIVTALMLKWGIPGGALALVKDGRLILSRGYGYADLETAEPVAADALFRIASVTKPVTAVAALRLHERGKLDLDAGAFSFRPDLLPPLGVNRNPQLDAISVRQLLWHVGGWDRAASGDPMFRPLTTAAAVDAPAPASCETVMRFMLGQPLDFAPGTRYAYSNFGYCVLGRVIAQAAGIPYEEYVRDSILAPLGITRMRVGSTRVSGRAAGEVRYYDRESTTSIFGDGVVPWPYGGFYLEAMDSHGGWIASAPDLLRFLTAVDGFSTRPDFLQPGTIATMLTTAVTVWGTSPYYYAMGWLRRPAQDNWWHDGSLPGTTSLLVRAGNGLAWAALFNARNVKPNSRFAEELDPAIWQAVGEVTSWPAIDLFN